MSENNGNNTSLRLKTGLAEMLKGGVIMDVMSVQQAEVAEKAGATAVMRWSACPPSSAPRAGFAHGQSQADSADHGHGLDTGHGEVPHRPLR